MLSVPLLPFFSLLHRPSCVQALLPHELLAQRPAGLFLADLARPPASQKILAPCVTSPEPLFVAA